MRSDDVDTLPETLSPRARRRLWLAAWLARRPEVLARLVRAYHRLKRRSVAHRRRLARGAAVTLAGAALLLALSSAPAAGAAIAVANGEVAVVENGRCSLAEAIDNANNTADGQTHDDCAAGNPGGADIITLPAGGDFVLTDSTFDPYSNLTTGLPVLNSTVTIEGNGATIRRDVSGASLRLMGVDRDGVVALRDLMMTGGDVYGGAVYSYGDLTIQNSEFVDNTESAVWATEGRLTISGSRFEGNTGRYGAVFAIDVPVTITGSEFTGNAAAYSEGGGVLVKFGGPVVISSSVFSDNLAAGAGGGVAIIWGDGATIRDSLITGNTSGKNGGGIVAGQTSLTLESSTVTNNSASLPYNGGGVDQYGGELIIRDSTIAANEGTGVVSNFATGATIRNTTISGNQGGTRPGGLAAYGTPATIENTTITDNEGSGRSGGIVFAGGAGSQEAALTIARTIVSGNEDPQMFVFNYATGGAVDVSGGFNLFGANGDAGVVGFTPDPTTVVPGPGVTTAQVLGKLGDNGGPTQTHALIDDSPAIDRAPSAACAGQTDQRGFGRNADGNGSPSANECDIGAYEAGAVLPEVWEAFVPLTARP